VQSKDGVAGHTLLQERGISSTFSSVIEQSTMPSTIILWRWRIFIASVQLPDRDHNRDDCDPSDSSF
jgi:hypothetical protein